MDNLPNDITAIRDAFPFLSGDSEPLIYLDNASTTQKPQCVVDAVREFYEHDYANVHRGAYAQSHRATQRYEGARHAVQRFVNAPEPNEIVFTRGTTEAINLVAATWGPANIGPGDTILVTEMEHHSNLVPWMRLAEQRNAELLVVPLLEDGTLDLEQYELLLERSPKLVAIAHVSNALGTINPVSRLVRKAHDAGALVLVDGAQAVGHMAVDVQALGCDFYAFSGHKMYGPTGIGVLWGRAELLEDMPPYQCGGNMVLNVTLDGVRYNTPPYRFEAGTPNIAGAIGLHAAIEFVQSIGLDAVAAHETDLLQYALSALRDTPGLRLIGDALDRGPIISFDMEGIHPHDIATILDGVGVAVRAGHHCAQPCIERFGVAATVRASLAMYNTPADIDSLVQGLNDAREIFT